MGEIESVICLISHNLHIDVKNHQGLPTHNIVSVQRRTHMFRTQTWFRLLGLIAYKFTLFGDWH